VLPVNCPAQIARVLLSILQKGILRTRSLAWLGESERCAVEADHIHNLPDLLAEFSPTKLSHYWYVARTAYANEIPEDQLDDWESLWQQLDDARDADPALFESTW
jgi:hypothetical protein